MTSDARTGLGIGLVAFGCILGVVGLLSGWNAYQRWMAVIEVREAQSLAIHAGRLDDARRVAASAASRVPYEAVPALLAADLSQPDSAERLIGLAGIPSRLERQTLLAAAGLARALAGRPTEVDLEGTGDGRMVAAIVATRAGREVGKLAGTDESPPHLAVERAALTVLARKAWEDGRRDDLRRYAGALVMLDPQQKSPNGMVAGLVLAAMATTDKSRSVEVLRQAGNLAPEQRGPVLRAVVALVPERRELLATQYAKDLEVPP